MRNRSLVPRPWWQVGLTVLPGLILLLRQVSSAPTPLDKVLRFLNSETDRCEAADGQRRELAKVRVG